MSDPAVTGEYFEEPVDDEIANGPDVLKEATSGKRILESRVLNHEFSELIVAD
jgi:hypothetical protein